MKTTTLFEQAHTHYRNKCFFRADPGDSGTARRPAKWEQKALRMARRFVRMFAGK